MPYVTIGYPSSGKTTISYLLSHLLNNFIIDTDIFLVVITNVNVNFLLSINHNERLFRTIELSTLSIILNNPLTFIYNASYGGGSITSYPSIFTLTTKSTITIIYILKCFQLTYFRSLLSSSNNFNIIIERKHYYNFIHLNTLIND